METYVCRPHEAQVITWEGDDQLTEIKMIVTQYDYLMSHCPATWGIPEHIIIGDLRGRFTMTIGMSLIITHQGDIGTITPEDLDDMFVKETEYQALLRSTHGS